VTRAGVQNVPAPSIHTGEGSVRASDPNATTPLEQAENWGSHYSRRVCIYFPVCTCFCSSWNKLL